jgi:hypothetical protein
VKLSPHFELSELIRTDHRGYLDEQAATAPVDTLRALATTILEPIRVHFAAPVVVHSGYRCPGLNAAIGGSTSSQHMRGEAADLHVAGVAHEVVWRWIASESGIPFGQVILEGVQAGRPTWVHVSLGEPYRPRDRCREILTWDAARGYHRLDVAALRGPA